MTKPREIELPACPDCGRISPLPTANWAGRTLCSGPVENPHPKARMIPTKFREVVK